ncbi:sodium/solute symporter [Lentzea flaviverrucosa]|uniref:Sodium:solute symporter family protein n=1 Tax=Lentzea flaviverrucosa TaxID=200379 RepID=A0A1H9WAS8_9PSEU|nr:cation acetate symporter [Lentzea flaviverrucosa]RDI22247.1 sodium:solute symporter family protein [Lentzea flaviverrucosa]SES30924.1 Sodium:solute symporter family protein [Lentzea flaviverrucosa]
MTSGYAIVAVVVVALGTILVGTYGLRVSRTTSDFYVASRTVSPWWNASAIGGEYLSAASFVGIAGLIFAYGPDMLWFPVGYTAGYLVLLTMVAAPLRRSGAYTLPDFAEARFRSRGVRAVASVLALAIGWLYLLPQLEGAGLTLNTVTGAPDWVGALIVTMVVTANVMSGGMRSITFVQAFQYWLKLTAITVPIVFLIVAWQVHGSESLTKPEYPVFRQDTEVTFQRLTTIHADAFISIRGTGEIDGARVENTVVVLPVGYHRIGPGSEFTFPKDAPVPHLSTMEHNTNEMWSLPMSSGQDFPVYGAYSLIIATFLGTMGLPHVIVRFYTNPNGTAARRTTLIVLGLLSVFYLMPPMYGALGRLYTPELLMTGQTDAVVLVLPTRMIEGVGGQLLGALVAGGAFAAFLSTSSGLVVSLAGVLSQDVLRLGGVRGFRISTVLAGLVPLAMTFISTGMPVADMVGLAFAVAASSLCPLLMLGIWSSRITKAGAIAGMLAGGVPALTAGLVTMFTDTGDAWYEILLSRPAAWTVPLGFSVMYVVSLLTPRHLPSGVQRTMVKLHAPENLGLDGSGSSSSAEERS